MTCIGMTEAYWLFPELILWNAVCIHQPSPSWTHYYSKCDLQRKAVNWHKLGKIYFGAGAEPAIAAVTSGWWIPGRSRTGGRAQSTRPQSAGTASRFPPRERRAVRPVETACTAHTHLCMKWVANISEILFLKSTDFYFLKQKIKN